MEQDSNPFWEHPMLPGGREPLPQETAAQPRHRSSDAEPEPAAGDFGVSARIARHRAVRREPRREPERPAATLEPWQQQQTWSGGWRDFLDAQPDPEPDVYRDEFDQMLALEDTSRGGRRRGVRRAVAIGCWAALPAVLVGFVILAFDFASPTPKHPAPQRGAAHPPTGAHPPTAAPPSTAADGSLPGPHATVGCLDTRTPDSVTGTGVGGTDSGPDAILWFEHSYYVERSAARARQAVAPAANVSAVDHLQHGIDSVPLGSAYCVRITPAQSDPGGSASAQRWHVELTEQRPGEQNYIIGQTISTIESDDGTVLITEIAAVE
jgi:hypothetical protein